MELLERGTFLGSLDGWLAEARDGHGRLVLVGGEAGIGKTSLVRAFCDRHGGDARFLWGACDALRTPRPLGPLLDIAREAGGELAELVAAEPSRHRLFGGFLDLLDTGDRPVVAVVEDAHWADEATLDLLVFVGRRVGGTSAMVVVTYRDDEARARAPAADGHRRPGHGRAGPPPRAPGADQGGRGHPGRPAGDRPRPPPPRPPAATPSSSPRCSAPPAGRCRRPCATPCWPARPGSRRGPAARSTPPRSCPTGSSWRSWRRSPGPARRPSTSAWPPGCSAARAAVSASATSWPGWRWSGRPAGSRVELHRQILAHLVVTPTTRRGWPTTPRRRAWRQPCWSTPRRPRAGGRARGPPGGGRPLRHRPAVRRRAGTGGWPSCWRVRVECGHTDRVTEALDASERALALWRREGDREREGALLARRCWFLWGDGRSAEALESAAAAVAVLEAGPGRAGPGRRLRLARPTSGCWPATSPVRSRPAGAPSSSPSASASPSSWPGRSTRSARPSGSRIPTRRR